MQAISLYERCKLNDSNAILRLFVYKSDRDAPRSTKCVQFDLPDDVDEEENGDKASDGYDYYDTSYQGDEDRDDERDSIDYTRKTATWVEHQQIYRHNRMLARFVKDLTVPDGTVVPSSFHFVKAWRMRNETRRTWPENTKLVFAGGDLFTVNGVREFDAPSIAPWNEVDMHVEMVAPRRPGMVH